MSRITELPPHWQRLASNPPTLRQPTKKGGEALALPVDKRTIGLDPAEPVASNPLRSSAKRRKINKTESAYAAVLKGQQDRGEILRFTFEGIRLKWGHDEKTGEAMHYKADFAVVLNDLRMRCIEVKGAHIFDRDLVRFKGCRACWPNIEFEMHQWKKGEWKRIH